jgi:hypothetical protein
MEDPMPFGPQHHHVDLYVHGDTSGNPIITEILSKLTLILTKENAMTDEIVEVKREVAETAAKMDAVLAVLVAQSADLAAVRQQLADAIAANDPAALAQVALDLDAIQAKADAVIHPPTP